MISRGPVGCLGAVTEGSRHVMAGGEAPANLSTCYQSGMLALSPKITCLPFDGFPAHAPK
jgi:hypothetical protein